MSDASRALARGRKITLINGTTYQVIFSLYTLAVIEDELGSLDELDELLATGSKAKLIRTIGKLLANAIVDGQGNPVEMSEETVLRQIAIEDIGTVFNDVQAGLNEAFRQAPATAKVDTAAIQQRIATATAIDSPGAHFSTSGAESSTNPSAVFGD